MSDPTIYVVLKEGDSHGTRAGTPLCVELDERTALYRKVGRCVRYVPAARIDQLVEELREEWQRVAGSEAGDSLYNLIETLRDISGASGRRAREDR